MFMFARRFLAPLLAMLSLSAMADALPLLSRMVLDEEIDYTVQPDDILLAIGARIGIDYKLVARQNHIRNINRIQAGRTLHIHNAHIVPDGMENGLLINIPQRMLFYLEPGYLMAAYPVGLGKPDWPTPEGKFQVYLLEMNKAWKVPESIQEEMRREQKAVQEEVPPGPDNPLGAYWMGLTLWGYGIHGTIAPSSIYDFRSHGCIRLHPDDIAELYDMVKKGVHGRLIYQPLLLAVDETGRLLLEVHPDIYQKGIDYAQRLRDMAEAYDLSQDIDWKLADEVISAQEGIARQVGRTEAYWGHEAAEQTGLKAMRPPQ